MILIVIFFIQSAYTYKDYQNKIQDEKYINYRNSISNITEQLIEIKKDKPEIEVLTFDRVLQIWLIMNDVKFIRPLSGQVVSKKHEMIENDTLRDQLSLNAVARAKGFTWQRAAQLTLTHLEAMSQR